LFVLQVPPERNNIHGFNANHSACLLFNIIFFADNQLHNYYLPYSNIQENTKKKRNHIFLNKCIGYPMIINLILSSLALGVCENDILKNNPAIEITEHQISSLIECSKTGNITAQFKLAQLYAAQQSKFQNFNDAYYWYLQAAKNGHSDAQFHVGTMLLDGVGVTEDSFEGIDWLFKASQAGHYKATKIFNYIMENPEPLDC